MSLFSSLGVSASGMAAQRARAELLVENLANAETTRTPEGGPYRRKDVVFAEDSSLGSFSSELNSALGGGVSGVSVSETIVDDREPDRRYMPGHPDADKDGYVAFPKINPAEDMVDLMGASRSYEANVAAISAVKDMIQKSLDLFR
jgi:flagellar basal-body rod protein FlgC